MLDFFINLFICHGKIRVLNYMTFLYIHFTVTAHFIYINNYCVQFAWIELLSKGDFKDANVT